MIGLVSINKPCGLSSSDVVIKCRNAYSKQIGKKIKCGHMGTLDPAASGVLILAFDKATRLFDLMQDKRKTYVADIKFGVETDTLDREGNITNTSKLPKFILIKDVINSFVGEIDQIPPKYSAISINGKRCYDLARNGINVELPSRKVKIFDLKILDSTLDGDECSTLKIEITCSSGTYIRSLVRDIAYKLNVVAYMSALDRISIGYFNKSNSVNINNFIDNPSRYIISGLDYLKEIYPVIEIEEKYRKKILNGVICDLGVDLPNISVLTVDNKLYGIGQTENHLTKSIINLWED